MKVVALIGKSSCGKSHTLNILYSLLQNNGYTQLEGNFRVLGNPKQEDFTDIMQKEDSKIGIFSMGDYSIGEGSVHNLLHELEGKGCVIAFCACTANKVRTVQAVERYLVYKKINKTISQDDGSGSLFRIDNFRDAKEMLSSI